LSASIADDLQWKPVLIPDSIVEDERKIFCGELVRDWEEVSSLAEAIYDYHDSIKAI
jgi:hypothetical protein